MNMMNIKNTTSLIWNDLISYKIKYGLFKGIYHYCVDFYGGKFFEKNKE